MTAKLQTLHSNLHARPQSRVTEHIRAEMRSVLQSSERDETIALRRDLAEAKREHEETSRSLEAARAEISRSTTHVVAANKEHGHLPNVDSHSQETA